MPFKKVPPLYVVWQDMLNRCRNPNSKAWKSYGGRGIKVCDRWKVFSNFSADMGTRPTGYTLDRIDNDGNYEPSNCKWSSRKEQQRNQTVTRKITVDGHQYIAAELAETYGFKTDTILKRAALGLSFKELVSKKRRVFTKGLALGGMASGAKKRAMTHCKKGHEFNERNTLITKDGWRSCRMCHAIRLGVKKPLSVIDRRPAKR